MSRKTGKIIIGVVSVLIVTILAAFIVKNLPQPEPELTEEQKTAIHRASIEGRFETALNTLLDDVSQQMQAYAGKRKIMQDLITSENLREPAFIEENLAIAGDMILAMNQDISTIFDRVALAENTMKALMNDEKITDTDVIMERWESLKNTQIKKYADFFAFEQELLDRYQRLLEVYYEGRENYAFSIEDASIVLDDQRLNARATILREDISSLKEAQKGLNAN